MALFGLIGSTKKLAEKYSGQESATERSNRLKRAKEMDRYEADSAGRRARHRSGGMQKAAAQGEAWERSQRKYGR